METKKILKTVVIFCAVIILICFLYSVQRALNSNIQFSEILDETVQNFLYTIGYGSAVDGEDNIAQNLFAMIGIISIALMTTFLTLNLFWRVDDVKISPKIAITKKRNEFYSNIIFSNEGNDICDLKVSFIAYDLNGNIISKEDTEHTYPLLVKKSVWQYSIPVKNVFWYKSLKSMFENSLEMYIYLTFSFVDTKNGQSSIKVLKYGKQDIIGLNKIEEIYLKNYKKDEKILCELKEMLLKNVESYDMSKLLEVENGGNIDLIYNEEEKSSSAKISLSSKGEKQEFVMALLSNKNDIIHFERFYSPNSVFRCMLSGDDGIKYVTLQIKKEDNNIILEEKIPIKDEAITYEYKLEKIIPNEYKEYPEEFLKDIKEICFTIFREDMCKSKALLKIYKAEIDSGKLN